jgi:hypothetical protein
MKIFTALFKNLSMAVHMLNSGKKQNFQVPSIHARDKKHKDSEISKKGTERAVKNQGLKS